MTNQDQNQTHFAETSPVFESVGPASTTPNEMPEAKEAKNKSKLPLVFGVAGVVLLIFFVVLLLMIKQTMDGGQMNGGDNQDQFRQENGEVDPLLEEIYDLDDQLQSSDPTIDEIPLPPVDLELRLDPKKR